MAIALTGLLALAVTASAQEAKEGRKGGRQNVQQRVDTMATELKLTADQKTKVTALYEEQAKKMQGATNLTQEERREKGRTMREDMDKKMKEILKPDQYEKWKQLRSQRGEGKGKGKGEGKKKD